MVNDNIPSTVIADVLNQVHDQQQAENRRLLEKARKQGNVRLIEVLERDEQGLSWILDGLDQIQAAHA